jgi:hypothetical protein
LVGDGYLLDFKALKALFLARQEAGDDVILLAPSKNPNYASYLTQKGYQGNRSILYVDTRAFFKDFYWLVILYGATLIKKEIIDNLFAKKLDEKYRHCNFAYPDYLFEYGVDHRLQASVQMSEAIDYNPEKKEGGWETKDQALAIWSKQLCHSFDLLPDFYNPLKASTLLAIGQTTGFFTKKGLLHLRAKRFVSLSLYHRYKPELKRTVKPFRFLFFVCLLPAWPLKVVFALRAKRHLRQQPTK